MKTLHSLALLAVLALSAASTGHGQTILNGSFEDPALTGGETEAAGVAPTGRWAARVFPPTVTS